MEKDYILSKDGRIKGEIRNLCSRPCRIEGCAGVKMHVKWPGGQSTYPCSKGCTRIGPHLWRIGTDEPPHEKR